jgi:hypothetical protein
MIDLILKEIQDVRVRENFSRIQRFLEEQVILDANWRLYEMFFDGPEASYKYKHSLNFVPEDVILLQVVGDRNVEFNHSLFTRENIDITVKGPCYIKFLAGRFREGSKYTAEKKALQNVSVGGTGSIVGDTDLVLVSTTIPASSTLTVDTNTFASFNHADYSMHFKNAGSSVTKSLKLAVRKIGVSLGDTVSSKFGSAMNLSVIPQVVGSNMEVHVTNNEPFNVDLVFVKTVF